MFKDGAFVYSIPSNKYHSYGTAPLPENCVSHDRSFFFRKIDVQKTGNQNIRKIYTFIIESLIQAILEQLFVGSDIHFQFDTKHAS